MSIPSVEEVFQDFHEGVEPNPNADELVVGLDLKATGQAKAVMSTISDPNEQAAIFGSLMTIWFAAGQEHHRRGYPAALRMNSSGNVEVAS